MLNKLKITKTHDLVELLNECITIQNDPEFEVLREDCQALTRYRLDFVYPSPDPEQISVEEAQLAIQKAHHIYAFVKQKSTSLGYSAI